ncbi:transglycosylase domain-containing protein [Oceanobacillus sp. FSL H7-0719]|uniref:transglycosylase domain-containing protein n=1 Tax=Oceanobacillus sp. FSL H7-0719 TaxID=2954507 RepID=UPI0032493DDD
MAENNQSRTVRRKQKKQTKKPKWKKILLILLFIGLLAGISVGAVGIYWIATAPDLDPEKLSIPLSSQLYDQNGELFATPAIENREQVKYEELPQVLIDAVTATEDVRFFEHSGIDLRRIGGAVIANIKDGFGSQGASTITQQVVENFFLSNEKKIKLKVQEQWLSLKLEREYSKEEILEMYLNKIFYGNNSYGVVAAAKSYFGVTDLNDLTLAQAAILAGLPQRPTAYNPFRDPELTAGRMDTVLKLMVRHGKISEEEAEEARQVDIPAMLVESEADPTPYEAFIDQVDKEISEKVEGVNMYTDGLKIHTTIDTDAQERVEFLLTDSESNPIPYPDDKLQGAIVVLDTKTGGIAALGGQRNSTGPKDYNYATARRFQPGSAIKPIYVYGPAIEYNDMSTYHQINDDKPFPIAGTDKTIKNITQTYSGWVTARTALSLSLNVPAVKLIEEVGYDNAKEFGAKLGIQVPDNLMLTDAIGGAETQVSPLDMAGAFRAFGNEGIYNEPYAVTSIEFPDGSTVDLRPESEAAMKDSTAYMVTDMMKSVMTNGTWTGGSLNGLPVAGKTGTTNLDDGSAGDRWFTGYTTNYTIAAWVGNYLNDEGKRIGLPDSVPSTISQQMFRETLTHISQGLETPDFVKPDSVVEVAVEKGSNPAKLASEYTPASEKITELFVKGTEPTKTSEKFDKLESVTDLKAEYNEDSNAINVDWNYDGDRDVSFKVSASVNGGSMQELSTTEDNTIEISEVEPGGEYTIQVVVISNDSDSLTSEAASTSVKVPDDEEEEPEEMPAVSGLTADYLADQGLIDVSWKYNGPPAAFEVTVNGQTQTVQSEGIEISGNFTPGKTYTINVVPIGRKDEYDGVKGPAQSVDISIPAAEEPEPDPEPEQDEEPDSEPENDENEEDANQDQSESEKE